MSSAAPLPQQPAVEPATRAQSGPRFPMLQLGSAIVATAGLAAFLLWTSAANEAAHLALTDEAVRTTELRGTITWLDEVLTMSARVAAATGDRQWQERYDQYLPVLDRAIGEAMALSTPDVRRTVDATTRAANEALIAMEMQAFDAAGAARTDDATTILTSAAYAENKRIYAAGMDALSASLAKTMADARQRTHEQTRFRLLVAAVAGGIVTTAWAALARTLWRWRARAHSSETRAQRLSEAALEGIIIHEETILDANRAFADMLGLPPAAVIGRSVQDFVAAEERELISAIMHGESGDYVEATFLRSDGVPVHAELRSRPFHLGGHDVRLTAVRDISERKRAEAKIRQLAHYDSLTGLPNRVLFWDRLTHALALARRQQDPLAVLCLDLDRFKDVNDTLGHAVGDRLLMQAADRLGACLRESDTLARLGGDEFAVIMQDLGDGGGAAAFAQRAIEAMSAPFALDGHEAVVGCSIGIALSTPGTFDDPETLLRSADLALYRAKADGRGTFHFFAEEMNVRLQARKSMERDLRAALVQGHFALAYQPQVALRSSRITGVEALVRWHHPELGTIMPREFIPLAEETGLIVPLGAWVLRTACKQALQWPDLRMAINLSAAQFRHPALERVVAEALADTGLEPSRLELEITEGILLEDTDANLATLRRIKDLGVRIAMDDFGTGYSSLSYLRRFPFDKIKIDGSFVRDLEHIDDAGAIVRAVVHLGRSLGMTTMAEGVEKLRQADILKVEGCDEVQGFYYGRPMCAEDIALLIDSPVQAAEDGQRLIRSA